MKSKKVYFLIALAFLMVLSIGSAAFAGSLERADAAVEDSTAAVPHYKTLQKESDWDAVIAAAVKKWASEQRFSSSIQPDVSPEAFSMIYDLGPEVVPYLLDMVEEAETNGGQECFLALAAYNNLHVSMEARELVGVDPLLVYAGNAQAFASGMRQLMEKATTLVEQICEADKPVDQKLIELNELGLLALPALTARLQAGETQWQPYFEAQMLSLTAEERFAALMAEDEYDHRENNGALVYAHRLTVARPVDVSAWKTENADAFTVLTESVG
ncbi:MAG: hypothetical protein J6R77_03880 [Clostridia bacterium]|nr:hypothetical protein [Clostridia bacterium]